LASRTTPARPGIPSPRTRISSRCRHRWLRRYSPTSATRGPLYSTADLDEDADLGFEIFSAIEFDDIGVKGAIERIAARVLDRPMYVSIGIDVLDPSNALGTGTPEAGGLTSRELRAVLRSFTDRNLVGADVVEVASAYDHAQITGIAASHAIYELLSAM
jgi:agmatinase